MYSLNIKKILVPLDGSKNSFRGLDEAIYLARQCHSVITGLYVIPMGSPPRRTPVSPIDKYFLKQASKFLEQAKTRAAQNGIMLKNEIIYGDKGSRIVHYAKNNHFDLIVIGARGQSAIKDIFLGSTSHYVLHKSPIPIMIVK
jgi:nucleotide-binding universal stress UspA family protein